MFSIDQRDALHMQMLQLAEEDERVVAGAAVGSRTSGAVERARPGSLHSPPAIAEDIFGLGVICAFHARACIERGRAWQAEHYVGAVRDHALALACLGRGLPVVQAARL